MRRGIVSLVIPAPADDVFDLVHDYGRRLEWDTLLRAAYLTDGHAAAGVGVTSVCVGRRALGGVALATRYVSFQRGKVAAVEMLRPTFLFARWAASIRHAAIGPRESRITYTYSFRARPRLLAWLLEPILAIVFRWETRKRLNALRRFFAAALVLLAIGCGGKPAPAPAPPPAIVEEAPAPRAIGEAPPDTAVLERDGGCWMADDAPVQCPATIVAPDPDFIDHGDDRISFDPRSFKCIAEGVVQSCPYELLPRLADGVAPTRQNGDDCSLGTTRVACP